MPQLVVDPVTHAGPPETPGGGPVIAGVQVRRATSLSPTYEPVQQTVTLAGGANRVYWKGRRLVVALSWSKITDAQKAVIAAALDAPVVTYAQDSTEPAAAFTHDDSLTFEAVAGTAPLRWNASVTLRGQDIIP